MQALHARPGSITPEFSRGFVREFGRRVIAKALDDAKEPTGKGEHQGSCKLGEGDRYCTSVDFPPRPAFSSSSALCPGLRRRRSGHSHSHRCSSYCCSSSDVGLSDNAHEAAV